MNPTSDRGAWKTQEESMWYIKSILCLLEKFSFVERESSSFWTKQGFNLQKEAYPCYGDQYASFKHRSFRSTGPFRIPGDDLDSRKGRAPHD